MPTPIARWNPARDVWETNQQAICGHSAVYSETFPTSGMTHDGTAYEQPTWEHRMDGSASSLLPTPAVAQYPSNRSLSPGAALRPSLTSITTLLPTPQAGEANGGGTHPDNRAGHQIYLRDAVQALLPTPRATDGTKGGPNQRGSSGDLMLPSAVCQLGKRAE